VLLPALEMASRRPNGAAELEAACRWATGWLHSARRLAPAATRPEGVLLLDTGSPLGVEAVYVQALELALRRAGLRVLVLSAELAERRFQSALRALAPVAVVICGNEAQLDVAGPLRRIRRQAGSGTRLYGYRAARLVAGREGVPSLGDGPDEATSRLLEHLP
jgi:MerR family transcriptional regulator, light-induced transcriptional regulator